MAIARAVLMNAPILVLDEATSSLDSESELYIQDSLSGLVMGRTVIAVAHRLSTIRKMDRIVVVKDGRIIEDGGPHDLLLEIENRVPGVVESSIHRLCRRSVWKPPNPVAAILKEAATASANYGSRSTFAMPGSGFREDNQRAG